MPIYFSIKPNRRPTFFVSVAIFNSDSNLEEKKRPDFINLINDR